MKTRTWQFLVGAGMLCVLATGASARDLTFTGFGGASSERVSKAMLQPYTKKTGIKITEAAYDGGISQMRLMVDSGNVTWDLVDVEGQDLYRGCEEGLYETIDVKSLIDTDDFVPSALGSPCGVGWSSWATVLAYNSDKIKNPPTSWADFFDLKKYPGKRGLRQGPQLTLEIALMADGVKADDVYKVLSTKEGVDRAFKKLDTIKSSIQWWTSGAQPQQWLAGGDVALTAAYNGRVTVAHNQGQPLAHIWNGQIYTYDYFVIVKGSPKKEEALALMKYMLSPEALAAQAKLIPYGPASKKAMAMLEPERVAEFPTAPNNLTNAVATSNEFWAEHLEDLTERFNAWAAQ
ncbi:ABC transporter substrate-binding protein [Ancylobacter mangrovi]|uniref:ABC transporter substrate-binding protein n=1 Tax=Ancylobacter mangrovi TaxID=2972472 RepID=UPI002161AB86|nr:ABC transporter substrate-binding protein [Ancylobacter mangrovi]MCS0503171.1 ABC transporter substrate-binding protein [Ancylobacter mangrovi]